MKFTFVSLSKFFLIASLFSVVIVTHFTIFPFVAGKIIFFRVMVELALLFYLLHVIATEHSSVECSGGNLLTRLLRSLRSLAMTNKIVLAVTIFVVIFSAVGFLGVDPANSFWSNYVRGEGVFQMWHYYAFFILLILLFRDEKDWRRLLIFFLVAGGLSLLLGIVPWLRAYHLDTRFKGAIGNPAFTATYLLFCLFFSLHLLRSLAPVSWRDRSPGTTALVLSIIISLSFLFLTGTRGALLGLIVGGAAAVLIIGLRKGLKFLKFKSLAKAIIPLIFGVCALGFLFYFQPFRIFQISPKEDTAQTRFWIWQSALKGWREKPLLGWGAENFPEVFDKYYDQRHGSADEGKEVWIDRAHSIFFDYLAETGILGLLAYLGIWVTYFYTVVYKYIVSARDLNFKNLSLLRRPIIIFLIFPIIYLVQGSLIFELLPSYIGLFVFLGLINFHVSDAKSTRIHANDANLNSRYSRVFAFLVSLILIILISGAFYFGSYRPFVKSILFNNALAKVDQVSSVEEFKNNFDKALHYYSSYGQIEELRMLGGVIMDLQKKNPPSEVNRALANYLNENYNSVKKLGAQDYYVLGKVNLLAGNKELSEKFYNDGRRNWPLRLEFEK